MYIEKFFDEIFRTVDKKGSYEIAPGVYLRHGDSFVDEQMDWDEDDEYKSFDFLDASDYWIVTNDGEMEPVKDRKEFIMFCIEYGFFGY
jgi:hypothetical protein